MNVRIALPLLLTIGCGSDKTTETGTTETTVTETTTTSSTTTTASTTSTTTSSTTTTTTTTTTTMAADHLTGSVTHIDGAPANSTLRISLVAMGDWDIGTNTLVSADLTATGTYDLALPTTADASDLSGDILGYGLSGAVYLPLVHEDTNGNGAYDANEVILGAALERMVIYVDGTSGTLPTGWTDGWSVTTIGPVAQNQGACDSLNTVGAGQAAPVFYDIATTPSHVVLRGEVQNSMTLSGTYTGLGGAPRLQVLTYGNSLSDQALSGGTFAVTMTGEPTALWIPTGGFYLASVGAAYNDDNADGMSDINTNTGNDRNDTWNGETFCSGNKQVFLRYQAEAMGTIEPLQLATCIGEHAGWNADTQRANGTIDPLDAVARAAVVIDASVCTDGIY